MKMILNYLFPIKPYATDYSLLLLCFRILFGILLMTHGLQKLSDFDALSRRFADPLGVGSTISLSLAIFGEVACSVGFIFWRFLPSGIDPDDFYDDNSIFCYSRRRFFLR